MSLYQNHSEQELSALLRTGDREAFVEIYRRNWRSLYNAAFRRLQDEPLCEDLVQNVFTDLWERRDEIVIENLPAYLHTAVRFQVIKCAARAHPVFPLVGDLESRLLSPLRAEDPLIEQETLDLVKLWVAALPEKRREIFLMYYTEELSSAKIAELLGVSRKTVQNQIAAATSRIRDQLSKVLFLFL